MDKTIIAQLSHDVGKFLSENFTPWTLHTFSEAHTSELIKIISTFVKKEDYVTIESDLRKCFLEFFNKMGRINVKILGLENITVQTKIRESTENTFVLLKKFKDKFERVEGSNLIIINETLTSHMLKVLGTGTQTFREDIKATLASVTPLGSSYAILFGKSRITVRTKLKESSSEKRFMGLPEEELAEITKSHFDNLDKEIIPLMQSFLDENFDFSTMSNEVFDDKHIKLLQEGLTPIVRKRCKQGEESTKGIVNYILRLQFENLHTALAELLIKHILSKNTKAENFLNFYTKGIVSIDSQKYKVPSLKDTYGTVWSYANINNVALQHQKFVKSMEKKGGLIDQMDDILNNSDQRISLAVRQLDKAKVNETENQRLLVSTAQKIKEIRHRFQSEGKNLDTNKRELLEKEVQSLSQDERDLIMQQRECERVVGAAQKNHSDLVYKKTSTLEQHNNEVDKHDEMRETHKDIQGKYNLVLSAISHALLGKKVKVD